MCIRDRMTDEQRESIKNSVNMLKDQVDDFLHKQHTRKKVTEESDEVQSNVSPLRAKILGEGEQ